MIIDVHGNKITLTQQELNLKKSILKELGLHWKTTEWIPLSVLSLYYYCKVNNLDFLSKLKQEFKLYKISNICDIDNSYELNVKEKLKNKFNCDQLNFKEHTLYNLIQYLNEIK